MPSPISFKVSSAKKSVVINFDGPGHVVNNLELIQIEDDQSAVALGVGCSPTTTQNFALTIDRHSLVLAMKHFIEELEPSTEHLILKQLQELNKTLSSK